MERHELIWEYQRSINEIYIEQGLTSLSGLDKFEINGKVITIWHTEATRKCWVKHNAHFNYLKNSDDLLFCSDELLYFTAHLYLYKPFLNNPIKEGVAFSGQMVYPNYQNLEAKRYSMFADVTCQKAYNYWDRIGDLIASFFPDLLKPHNVYFPSAIEAIPRKFHKSNNYLWLKEFKENEYVTLNNMRKQIVHYTTSDIDFRYKHLKLTSNRESMQELQNDREDLADFYKNHIYLTLTGLEKTLLFFDEINPILFDDVE